MCGVTTYICTYLYIADATLCTVSFGPVSPEGSWSAKRWIMWVPLPSLQLEGRPPPHIHPVYRCKFQTRCATLTPSPFLLSNCVLCLPSTCIHYLTSFFSPATNRMDSFLPSTNISSLGFLAIRLSSPLLKIKSSSRLACFILLASSWRILVPDLSQMRKSRLLHTNPVMGSTTALPRQVECTVTSQRQSGMAMFIVGRWKKLPVGISFSR